MDRFQSKYFNTEVLLDEALISLLDKKDIDYITVKDICTKAGVNRSTFYLHYENIDDLLYECNLYIKNKFYNFLNENIKEKLNITSPNLEDLYLITPNYLVPYLTFIKENKKFYQTIIKHSNTLKLINTYNELFLNIFDPILERFNVSETKKEYLLAFYIEGIMAITSTWLKNDCNKDINEIVDIIMTCVKR